MRMRQLFGVLLIGAVALVGCGGDDDDDTATATTTAESSATTTGGSGAITQARCVEAATAMAQAATDIPLALSGTSAGLRDSVDAFNSFADSAPSEIRDDLQTIADGYDDFVKVLADANITPASGQQPTAEDAAKIQAAALALDAPSFKEASARVTAWFADECGG